jgi:hypothetical protein
MPLRNDGIYWTPIRATEERCNLLQKSKRRAGRYGLRIQSKRSVTITWHMQFSPLVWLIPMPSRNDGIYWTPIRGTEERCNLLEKSKRRAGRYGLQIQSKRSVTITWQMQISPLVWLIPMPSRNDGIYWTPIRATEECCSHLQKSKRRAGGYGLRIQSKRSITITWHMQISPLVWLIPMPSHNDGIYWTPIRATEECCNLLEKSKRRAGIYGLRIQSKRTVTITWHMQFSPTSLADPNAVAQ